MERNSSGLVLRSALIFLLLSSCNLPRPAPESQPLIDPKPVNTRPIETPELPPEDQKEPPSQEPFWMIAIGGEGRDYAPSVLKENDGFVAVGMTSSYGLGDGGGNLDGSHDFLTVKLDLRGNLIWSRVIGGPDDERGSYSVNPTSDGGYLLTGSTRSFGSGGMDIFVVKLKNNGDLDWSRAIGGPNVEGGFTTIEVENGYLTLGDTSSLGAGKRDLLLVKMDFTGQLLWAKTYGGPEDEIGSGITRMGDGFLIGGTVWSFGAGEADAGLLRLDPAGNLLWAKTIGGSGGEGINWDGVRITSDGGIAFGEKTASYGALGGGAIFGIKLNRDAELEWCQMADGPLEDAGWTMTEVSDGFIAGGKLTLAGTGGDIVLIKFTKEGTYQWARIFGEAGLDEIEEIQPAGSGYILAGVTRMVDPAGDFLIAKVNGEGYVGGDSDPITNLEFKEVVSTTPQIIPFTPQVMDGTGVIQILTVTPAVSTPELDITIIAMR
ncbi:MAG: hypothetical protein WBB69_13080 [Anaerolineales bacterium]